MEAEEQGVIEEASFVKSAENYRAIGSTCSPNAASFARSEAVCH